MGVYIAFEFVELGCLSAERENPERETLLNSERKALYALCVQPAALTISTNSPLVSLFLPLHLLFSFARVRLFQALHF